MRHHRSPALRPLSAMLLFASLLAGCGLAEVRATIIPPATSRPSLQGAGGSLTPPSSSATGGTKGDSTTSGKGNNAGGNGVGDIASSGKANGSKDN